MMSSKVFLLSPANSGGERAQLLLNPDAQFDLACRVRSAGGAPIGEIFAFLSGLYFRGKLAYAARFQSPPTGRAGSLVITTSRGLLPPETHVAVEELRAMGEVPIDSRDLRYR